VRGIVRLEKGEGLAGSQCCFSFNSGPILRQVNRCPFVKGFLIVRLHHQDNGLSDRFALRAPWSGISIKYHAEEGTEERACWQGIFFLEIKSFECRLSFRLVSRSVAPAVAGSVVGASLGALLLLLSLLPLLLLLPLLMLFRRLPVEQNALNVHAQLGHFFKPFGGDEVLLVALSRVFHDPLQLLRGFDKDASDRKGIHGSETVLVLGLGCHWSPLIEDGKISALLSLAFRMR